MRESIDLVRAWRALPSGAEAVLATVVTTHGSVYRRPGARMLLTREGWIAGSISGGCLESDLVQTAFDRTEGGAALVTYDASAPDDILLGFGLGCNGIVEVLMQRLPESGGPLAVLERVVAERRPTSLATYADGGWSETDEADGALLVERLLPPHALYVFGAGHDAVPLARIAGDLGWYVTVADGRSAYARPERFPNAQVVVSPSNRPIPIEPGASVVLMTHSFNHDLAILRWALESEAGYLGVLGPIHRTKRLMDEMGLDTERLHAPIGLDLGADGPDEIALAIVSEILAVRKGRAGGHLKGRMTPLHERRPENVGRLG